MASVNPTIKIGFLIPSTSNGREWKSSRETYLYITIVSFINSLTPDERMHGYNFYIGIDRNDPILDKPEFKHDLQELVSSYHDIHMKIEYLYMDGINKGHLTVMWNRLFHKALADGCDYFYQCGDDIDYKTIAWITDCINQLTMHDGIGMTGPINNNPNISTQSFVSRKHHHLFGYFFPEEIENWYCDDWINEVYRGINHYFPLKHHTCDNNGGNVRYAIKNVNYKQYVERDLRIINNKH
jgi:hypothetical protein